MNRFAKLFDFPDGQLLVIKEYDPHEEKHDIIFQTECDGCKVQLKYGFGDGKSTDDIFGEFDSVQALKQYEKLQDIGNGNTSSLHE